VSEIAVDEPVMATISGPVVLFPGVTPAMWSWWFGWHGCDTRRYKLWHSPAHLFAAWKDGDDAGRHGSDRYIGPLVADHRAHRLLQAQWRNPIRCTGEAGLSPR
jgi:hypothetical protein